MLKATATWGLLVCNITSHVHLVRPGMETWGWNPACVPQKGAPSFTATEGPCGWGFVVLNHAPGDSEERCLLGHPGVRDLMEEDELSFRTHCEPQQYLQRKVGRQAGSETPCRPAGWAFSPMCSSSGLGGHFYAGPDSENLSVPGHDDSVSPDTIVCEQRQYANKWA